MKKHMLNIALLIGILGITTQCNRPKSGEAAGKESAENSAQSLENAESPAAADTALYATLESIDASPSLQDSLMIRFTVSNPTKDSLKFTTYHTPFEGIMSKFLTVTNSEGNEVSYLGPMAKRVMPPPAETYHTLAPGQAESINFDLKKAYKIESAGTYTLQYNGEKVSGIANGEALTITVTE